MKKKKISINAATIVAILIAAALIVGGYFLFNKDSSNKTKIVGQDYFLKNGAFSVFFPEEPVLSQYDQDFGNGNNVSVYTYDFTTSDKSIEVGATYAPSAFVNLKSSPEENLKNEIVYTSSQMNGQDNGNLIYSNPTEYNGLPAIDYLIYYKTDDYYQVGRDVAKGDDLYMLGYLYPSGKEDKQLKDTFLNSLTFSALTQKTSETNSQQTEINSLKKTVNDLKNTKPEITKNLPDIIKQWSPYVALVLCTFADNTVGLGSGFLTQFVDGSIVVITNKHVISDKAGYAATSCSLQIPGDGANYYTVSGNETKVSSDGYDWGYLIVTNGSAYFNSIAKKNMQLCQEQAQTGENVVILGYPGYAGSFTDPTATQGIISGYGAPYYTTSAKIEAGNSGGVAVQPEKDCYLGIPSAVKLGMYENLGRILNVNTVFQLNY